MVRYRLGYSLFSLHNKKKKKIAVETTDGYQEMVCAKHGLAQKGECKLLSKNNV